ncbi:hypothetical protein H8356DRAFT_1353149 [Neocallimastix lanati (nom. inval.)]|nr:hypothetical protein H8356DRAFT_1353149 [Neocallimastix sp. JGI-2020a]
MVYRNLHDNIPDLLKDLGNIPNPWDYLFPQILFSKGTVNVEVFMLKYNSCSIGYWTWCVTNNGFSSWYGIVVILVDINIKRIILTHVSSWDSLMK